MGLFGDYGVAAIRPRKCLWVDVRPWQAERKLTEQLASLDIFKLDVIAREMKRSASVLPRRCRRLQCRVRPCEYPETTPRVRREYPRDYAVSTPRVSMSPVSTHEYPETTPRVRREYPREYPRG